MPQIVKSLCSISFLIAVLSGIVGCAGGPLYQLDRWNERWPKDSYEIAISYIDSGYIRIVNGESKLPEFHPNMRSVGHTNDALCIAILDGYTNNVRALLDRGANPNRTCEDSGRVFSALDEAVIWGSNDMQQAIRAKGGAFLNPEIKNPATRDQEIASVRKAEKDLREGILVSARAQSKKYHEEQERQQAEERAARNSRNDVLGKLVVGVGIAALTSQANISDEAKVQIMSATAQDLASNGEGTATANLLNSPLPSGQNTKSSGTSKVAQGAGASSQSTSDMNWRQCGPAKKCLVGDGLREFCSGPYDSSKPMCKSECSMDSLVLYHDTTLKPGAYIPGTGRCTSGSCNVVNSCN